jgi:hypothetical protein
MKTIFIVILIYWCFQLNSDIEKSKVRLSYIENYLYKVTRDLIFIEGRVEVI